MSTATAGGTLVAPGIDIDTLPPGAIGSNAAVKPVTSISTGQGADAVSQMQDQVAKMSPPPPVSPADYGKIVNGSMVMTPTYTGQNANVPDAQKGMNYDGSTGGTKTTDTGEDTSNTKITLLNEDTGQSVSFTNPDGNQAQIQSYLDSGYAVSDAEGDLPSWLGPNGVSSSPEVDAATKALSDDKDTVDSAKTALANLNVNNDPNLQSLLDSIGSQWDSRISQQQDVVDSKTAQLTTGALRNGAQYTGGLGGVTGSVISAEEKSSINTISQLQMQKTQALVKAKMAFQNQQFTQYSKAVTDAQTAYDKQFTELQTLQKAQKTQDDALQTQKMNNEVTKLYAAGTTDAATIYSTLIKEGYNTTLKDVGAALTALTPKAASTDDFKLSQPQTSQLLGAGINSTQLQALHDYYNGKGDSSALTSLTPAQQTAVHDALNGTASKIAASAVPTYAQLHPKSPADKSTTYKSGTLAYTNGDLQTGNSKLQDSATNGPQADGKYANPDLYLEMANKWTASGGSIKDFLKNYPVSSWINPANTTVGPAIDALVKQDAAAVSTKGGRTL